MTYKGTIKGKTIELDESLPFPEGSAVVVSVVPGQPEPERGSPEALREAIANLPELQPGDVDELERAIAQGRQPLSRPCKL